MPADITSTDLALLHHLQVANTDAGQLPKHVASELEQQGLVESDGPSPGSVKITAAGLQRLQALESARQRAGDVLP
jgi:hypothetical protein